MSVINLDLDKYWKVVTEVRQHSKTSPCGDISHALIFITLYSQRGPIVL